MDRAAALQLLDSLERNGVGDTYAPTPQEFNWWKEMYPRSEKDLVTDEGPGRVVG